jgi:hypothetical protein
MELSSVSLLGLGSSWVLEALTILSAKTYFPLFSLVPNFCKMYILFYITLNMGYFDKKITTKPSL